MGSQAYQFWLSQVQQAFKMPALQVELEHFDASSDACQPVQTSVTKIYGSISTEGIVVLVPFQ